MKGKQYQTMQKKVDASRSHPLPEAIELAKSTSYTSFDGSVELHVRLVGKKPEERQFRTQLTLPNGTGKTQRVEVLTEEKVEEIAKSGNAPADLYLATPELMPKVAKIAKILGPKGKMPNPKSGTVTAKPEERVEELSAGNAVELRSDPTGIIHTSLGKVSWTSEKLVANAEAVLRVIPRSKIGSVTLAATMGPGIKVTLS